jgi:hypothetical protein
MGREEGSGFLTKMQKKKWKELETIALIVRANTSEKRELP